MRRLWRRLRTLMRVVLRRGQLEQDLDVELRFHLEMEQLENERRGMQAADAREAAISVFGAYERVKEQCRDARGGRTFEMLAQDIRLAIRTIRAYPGVSAAAVMTLGLGIGANTAMFSVVNGVLLQPLPYQHEKSIVHIIQRATHTGEEVGFSPLEFQDYRAENTSFDTMVEYHSMSFNLIGSGEAERVKTAVVSAEFFDVMGLKPLLGRTFRHGEDADDAEPVVVLSHAFWQRAFRAESVVGRKVEMNDRLHTVIGVLPPAPLAYPNPDDVYMPISSCPFRTAARWRDDRQSRGIAVFGRLRMGVSRERALGDLQAVARRLRRAYPDAYPSGAGTSLEALSLRDELTHRARPTLRLLIATSLLVLLIACANVANLMMAAVVRRDRELALRTALGAGRGRLVRQLLTESTLLAVVGGGVAVAIAFLSRDMLVAFAERFTPRAHEIAIDGSVLAFTFGLSIATGLLFGILPAVQRQDLVVALKDGGDRSAVGFGGRRARRLLIIGQLAVSFMLLIAAGLTLRSLNRLQSVDAGFNPENVLTARLDLNWSKYKSERTILQFTDRLLAGVRAAPGVGYAAVANTFPLHRGGLHTETFQIRGREEKPGTLQPVAYVRSASNDYFAAIGVRLVRGRLYDSDDMKNGRSVSVISESLAHRYWSDGDPIGQEVSADDGRSWTTIVGVVSDVRHDGLDSAPATEAYVPWPMRPWRDLRLVVRTDRDPTMIAADVRRIVHAIDAMQPVTEMKTLMDFRSDALSSPRLTAILLGAFAALALGIAATGLAGVVAFSVSQRTREFGMRIVLGAHPHDVLRMVVRESLMTVLIGLALGVAGALAFTRTLSGLLFEIEPRDPVTFVSMSVVLLAVAIAACVIPARRVTLVQPVVALRTS